MSDNSLYFIEVGGYSINRNSIAYFVEDYQKGAILFSFIGGEKLEIELGDEELVSQAVNEILGAKKSE